MYIQYTRQCVVYTLTTRKFKRHILVDGEQKYTHNTCTHNDTHSLTRTYACTHRATQQPVSNTVSLDITVVVQLQNTNLCM